jgi:hypothetical protein
MSTVMTDLGNWEGYRRASSFTEAQIADAMELIQNVQRYPNHVHDFMMREAVTSTDFANLFGTIVDREMMARYKIEKPDWESYTKVGSVSNFNEHTRHRVTGMNQILPRVGEKGEYLVAKTTDTKYTRQVFKRGKQFDISWEAMIDDGMGAFDDVPAQFAEASINTEAWQVASLIAAAAGPNPLLFGAPIVDVDGVNVTNLGALPLTMANLQTTMGLMMLQTDRNGHPLRIRGIHLVTDSMLEMTARSIITSVEKMWTQVAAGGAAPYPTTSIMPQMGIKWHSNDWLPYIDTTSSATTWYLFADLAQGAAIGFDRLKGHEVPEIVMKASNKVTTTGGIVNPFDGDFESDNIFYRVRVVGGGSYLDPRHAYAQVG